MLSMLDKNNNCSSGVLEINTITPGMTTTIGGRLVPIGEPEAIGLEHNEAHIWQENS